MEQAISETISEVISENANFEEVSTYDQKMQILAHLKNKGSLTSMEALSLYGVARLASRICDLKVMGYEINTEMISVLNRYNKKVRVARYTLKESV